MLRGLAALRKEPARVEQAEPALLVEVMTVQPEDVPVVITGYGAVRPLNEVRITAEVAGRVVEIHPRLEEGEVIPEGELLFRIDQRDYLAARDQAQAQVAQAENGIDRLKKQYAIDQERLETLRRTRELANREYTRLKTLFEQDEVGTLSGVDNAEMALNQANDAFDQLSQAVDLYPIRIAEARSGLESARAQLEQALARLERTEVHAPFGARIKQVQLERGQYVAPGASVLTLADDEVLEISVPLDSRDARSWLEFEANTGDGNHSWFGELKPVDCEILWTEDPGRNSWRGVLHRVERFDETTRTVTVAVRIEGERARSAQAGLPLVDGMFCEVRIPGKPMENVFRLPRWAVSFEGQVWVSEDMRLKRRDVEVLRNQNEESFVASGLEPGELVVVTRLVNPLPNSKLEFAGEVEERAMANAPGTEAS